jgi:hypothetical protein
VHGCRSFRCQLMKRARKEATYIHGPPIYVHKMSRYQQNLDMRRSRCYQREYEGASARFRRWWVSPLGSMVR